LLAFLVVPFASASSITFSGSIVAGESVTFTFNDGFTNLTSGLFIWCWGDGSANTTTSLPYASHVFSSFGSYSVSVDVFSSIDSDGWEVSGDWVGEYEGLFTEEVTVLPNSMQQTAVNFFDNIFAAVALASIAGLLTLAGAILFLTRGGSDSTAGGQAATGAVAVLIVFAIGLALVLLVSGVMQNVLI
jgi:hypothetical protein